MASCWESFTSALSPQRDAALGEQLLSPAGAAAERRLREQADALLRKQDEVVRETAAEAATRLRERADALRREHDEVVGQTAEEEVATIEAEIMERIAEADRRVAVMTKERHEEELRLLIKDLEVDDRRERVRVLEAILDTVKSSKKPV